MSKDPINCVYIKSLNRKDQKKLLEVYFSDLSDIEIFCTFDNILRSGNDKALNIFLQRGDNIKYDLAALDEETGEYLSASDIYLTHLIKSIC